jgi:putative oligomerization/nucleic acid binding protein
VPEAVELPGAAHLADDEFVVHTAKDWGLSVKPLILTNRRLFCPTDLTGRSSTVLRLIDVRSVALRKHWVGFSTILVETLDRRQVSFAAHINGPLIRSDIAAAVDQAQHEASAAAASPPTGARYDQLQQINELKKSGVLSEAEFEEEKARILKQP